jgi:hypothetical protein
MFISSSQAEVSRAVARDDGSGEDTVTFSFF